MQKHKKLTKSRKHKISLSQIVVGVILIASMGLYAYQSFASGTGIFSLFSQNPAVNQVSLGEGGGGGTSVVYKPPAKPATVTTPQTNKVPTKVQTTKQKCLEDVGGEWTAQGCVVSVGNNAAAPAANPPAVNPAGGAVPNNGGGSSSNTPKTCPTGNPGVNVQSGTWVPTGANMGTGKENQRECVQITDSCGHSKSKACNEVVADPTQKVVLPVGAGPEYTVGKSAAQVNAEAKAANKPAEVPVVKNQCYDKTTTGAWVIVPDGTTSSSDASKTCGNGTFIPTTAYEAAKKAELKKSCEADAKHTYSDTTGCSLIPTGPTEEQKKAQADTCAKANKEYDPKNPTACGKDLKCGKGFTERDGYCDIQGGMSEVLRESILRDGQTHCHDLGNLPFDPNTGLCQNVTSGRPFQCKAGLSTDGKSFTDCKKEDPNDKNRVTGSAIRFCSAPGKFDANGVCQPPVAAGLPAAELPKNPSGKASTPIIKGDTSKYCQGSMAMIKDKNYGTILNSNECGTDGCNPSTADCNPPVKPPANTTPIVNAKSKVVSDTSADQTYKAGQYCLTKSSCADKCEGGVYTTVNVAQSGFTAATTQQMCGNKSSVSQYLKDNKYINVTAGEDNSATQTLKVGDECNDAVFSSNKCSSCKGGVHSVVAANGNAGPNGAGLKKVCGSSSEIQTLIGAPAAGQPLVAGKKNPGEGCYSFFGSTNCASGSCKYSLSGSSTSSVPGTYCADSTGSVPQKPKVLETVIPTTNMTTVADNAAKTALKTGDSCLNAVYQSCGGCPGGVATHYSYALQDQWRCGSADDVKAKLKDLNVNGANVYGDNKSYLNAAAVNVGKACDVNNFKCSECDSDALDQDNVTTVTHVVNGNEIDSKYCGTADQVKQKQNLTNVPSTVKIVKDNGQVGGVVQGGPSQCKYTGGQYTSTGGYACPNPDGSVDVVETPVTANQGAVATVGTKKAGALCSEDKSCSDSYCHYDAGSSVFGLGMCEPKTSVINTELDAKGQREQGSVCKNDTDTPCGEGLHCDRPFFGANTCKKNDKNTVLPAGQPTTGLNTSKDPNVPIVTNDGKTTAYVNKCSQDRASFCQHNYSYCDPNTGSCEAYTNAGRGAVDVTVNVNAINNNAAVNNTVQTAQSQYVYFNQRDPQWEETDPKINKNGDFTCANGAVVPFEKSGCGQTVDAMMISTYTNNKMTPVEVKDKYFSNPAYCGGSGASAHLDVLAQNGFTIDRNVKQNDIPQYLADGKAIFAGVQFNFNGKIVTHNTWIIGQTPDGQLIFNDPWYGPNVNLSDFTDYTLLGFATADPPNNQTNQAPSNAVDTNTSTIN